MLCFKEKNQDLYLITNYKVMYSTFTKQPNLEQVDSNKLVLKVLINQLHLNKARFYLIVRDPYDRAESFFKDKFRQSVKKIEKKGEWQHTHKIFFPYLGIQASMSDAEIADKFLSVTFEEFISYLGDVYQINRHLCPQHWAMSLGSPRFPYLNLPIKFIKVFKMESESDLSELSELFDIDLDVTANSTRKVSEAIIWGKSELEMVERIYEKDFDVFGYVKRKSEKVKKRKGDPILNVFD